MEKQGILKFLKKGPNKDFEKIKISYFWLWHISTGTDQKSSLIYFI